MFGPLIVQEIDPSRSLGLLRVRRAPMGGRAAQKSDEFALSHANVLVEDEAYHKGSVVPHRKNFPPRAEMGQSLPKHDLGITSACSPTAEIKGVEPN